ncbi:MAG: aspartate aminotransferase family protein [Coriobacteriia bacterium]|nr:aspartate aminotransferase family protein [Coriobacteriia bacterium]
MSDIYQHAKELDEQFHMHTYARKPVMFVTGEGMRLYDDDGREYLDFVSGIGVINLGHSHPAPVKAACEQMAKLTHVTNLYYVEHRSELAADLVKLFGGGAKAFFCNSGTEATEGAIKLARKWATEHKAAHARTIVTAWHSFHGRTLAALAATGQPSKQDAFKPLPAGFAHVSLNDMEALDAAVDENVCAVMLEPVQGEGGVHPCTPEYLAAVRALCDERGVLLIMDEVQCGLYRTGYPFAHQGLGVKPDIMTLAKALANGLPIGAILASDAVAASFAPGDHGSTFAGGPVVCAAARATLKAMAELDLGARALELGAYFAESLGRIAQQTGAISDIRCAGLMLAIDLVEPRAAQVAVELLGAGVLVNNIGTHTIRFLPPLVCTTLEIDTLCEHLHTILVKEPS